MALQTATKKRLSPTVTYLLSGLIAALAGFPLCTFALRSWRTGATLIPVSLAAVGVYLFVFAGLIPMMMAYMQKIVPFLWFEYRFSKSKDRKSAPLIDEMVPKPVATTGFISYYIGVISGLVYLLPSVARPASHGILLEVLFGFFSIFGITGMFSALAKVVRIGGKRPADS